MSFSPESLRKFDLQDSDLWIEGWIVVQNSRFFQYFAPLRQWEVPGNHHLKQPGCRASIAPLGAPAVSGSRER